MSPSPTADTSEPDPAASAISRKSVRVRRWRRVRARVRLWRIRMRSNPMLYLTWRITVGVVGTLVLIAGIIMCVTPGPGIGGIILGLAILSTEFTWARGLLWRARRYAHAAKVRADKALATRRAKRAGS